MKCFQVTEHVRPGLFISRHGEPHIPTPTGCALKIQLDKEIVEFVRTLPKDRGQPRLQYAAVDFAREGLVLRRSTRRTERQALVRIETAGGVNGRVFLRANGYSESMERGWVRKDHDPFPPPGIQPLCTDEEVTRVNAGIEMLDLMCIMNPGSSFRIDRTGQLEGASPFLCVRWNGNTMKARYDERGNGAFLEATAGV